MSIEGFRYQGGFLTPEEQRALLAFCERAAYGEVRMHGVAAKRKTAHYGLLYGYETWTLTPGPALPPELLAARERAARWAGVAPEELVEALVTVYPPGAGIGWHRDAPPFGEPVIGLSLSAPCRMRFKRDDEDFEARLEPGSIYALSGPARWQWRHHIPPVKSTRYSVTFRRLRRSKTSTPSTGSA